MVFRYVANHGRAPENNFDVITKSLNKYAPFSRERTCLNNLLSITCIFNDSPAFPIPPTCDTPAPIHPAFLLID